MATKILCYNCAYGAEPGKLTHCNNPGLIKEALKQYPMNPEFKEDLRNVVNLLYSQPTRAVVEESCEFYRNKKTACLIP